MERAIYQRKCRENDWQDTGALTDLHGTNPAPGYNRSPLSSTNVPRSGLSGYIHELPTPG